MKIIKPSVQVLTDLDGKDILRRIEVCSRTCYKSESLITDDSAGKLVAALIKNGHEAMLEHVSISARVICDRGVSHEIVRHRMASYAQESQRYINYSKEKHGGELTFIEPCFWTHDNFAYMAWKNHCAVTEKLYLELLSCGNSPQEARSVLPNSTKTEIVMTLNLRSWRNFFKLRLAKDAHPSMREVANLIFDELSKIPVVFDDLKMFRKHE
jgi:thymidylate synthase (FAD)